MTCQPFKSGSSNWRGRRTVATDECMDCGQRIWNAGYRGKCDCCHEDWLRRDTRKISERTESVELLAKDKWDSPKRRGAR
jgi:hypothetical protein